jgi:hypothetical protein
MVVSLYVCEIPKNVNKNDLEELFKSMDGYIECRVKGLNEMRKIAFIDFKDLSQARFAMDTLQGFKFSPSDKGLIIKVSDNTKGGSNQTRTKKGRNNTDNSPRKYNRTDSSERYQRSHNTRRREKEDGDSFQESSRSRSRKHSEESNHDRYNYNHTKPQESTINPTSNPANILDLISLINTATAGTNKPYTIADQALPLSVNVNQPETNSLSNLLECLQNLQTVQLLSSLTGTSTLEKLKETPQNISHHSSNVIHSSPSNPF